ncbi:MAG: cytochrome c biogenesis protein CcsA, partial [Chloroflexi bacterium]|nr:cytochrome c biogenesis protein CcsA [Chloroflexota bacterium]
MIPEIGFAALVLSLVVAVYTAVAAYYGNRNQDDRWIQSARNATIVILPLIFLSCAMIVTSILQDDFSVEYVTRVSSRDMPTYLKVSSLWGGQAGSLMLWNLLLAVFAAASMARNWGKQKELMPNVIMVSSFTQIFFLALSVFVENPFAASPVIPLDGNGLNPLLRHPGMIIHPPILYLGYVGFLVPFAFAMAALISGKLDDTWIRTTRRWTLVAW